MIGSYVSSMSRRTASFCPSSRSPRAFASSSWRFKSSSSACSMPAVVSSRLPPPAIATPITMPTARATNTAASEAT